jgi:signal transduction histidine kinase
MILSEGLDNDMNDVLEYSNLIKKSGNTVLELSGEILKSFQVKPHSNSTGDGFFNLLIFKEKLEQLYLPQARNKNINYQIFTSEDTDHVSVSKNKLLQIAGNLISNALKFTPVNGIITVTLTLKIEEPQNSLHIIIKDNGVGMSTEQLNSILSGKVLSKDGTSGEQGYGFGLAMVKNLVESLHGEIKISSVIGEGTTFDVRVLPAGLEQ